MKYIFNAWNKKFSSPEFGTKWTIEANNQTEAEEKAEKTRAKLDRGNNQIEVEFIGTEQ